MSKNSDLEYTNRPFSLKISAAFLVSDTSSLIGHNNHYYLSGSNNNNHY